MDRRRFLKTSTVGAAGLSLFASARAAPGATSAGPLYRISLAQWSLHKAHFSGEMTNLKFPVISREAFGIDAIEYVNTFMRDESRDPRYITDLKNICDGEGVTSLLIMCDREGRIGDPDEAARITTVENHYRWIEIGAKLGCHSIRVNAASVGDWNTQRDLAADGLRRLTEFAAGEGLNVIVENHGGISSNGAWLAEVMRTVDHPRCGTLPDFGNFNMGKEEGWYDIYKGVEELMPFAKGVTSGYLPLGGVMVADRIAEVLVEQGGEFFHGYTYSGHPAACAVAIENIKVMQREDLIERVKTDIGPYLKQRWEELGEHPLIGETRMVGLMGALELVANKDTLERFDEDKGVGKICRDFLIENGLVMRTVGDTLVVAPPLILSHEQADELVEKAWKCLDLTQAAL